MEDNNNLPKKSSIKQCNHKQQEILNISNAIVSGKANVGQIERSLSLKSTLNQPTMRSVFKDENSQVGFSLMNVLVVRFIDSFGFSNKLNDTQIEMITIDALEHFGYESIHDVILFFKKARSGSFGTTNRNIDSNLIFGTWLPLYLEQKAEIREQEYISQKNNRKQEKLTYEQVKESYSKALSPKKEREYQEKFKQLCLKKIDVITKDFDRQMLEDLITDWTKDPTKKEFLDMLKRKRKTIK